MICIGSEEDMMKTKLAQTVNSICVTVQGLGDDIVRNAKEREKQEIRMLSALDESIAKLRESSNNLHKVIR